MNLSETFRRLKAQPSPGGGEGRHEMAFIPYVTAGFPTLAASMELVRQLSDHGADVIEVGVPFSDPVADGPVIQHSSDQALKAGVTLTRIFEALGDLRVPQPLVLMSYLNPLLAYGRQRLFESMQAVGMAGLIVPDLPLEEAGPWTEVGESHDVDLILMITPTTSVARMAAIARQSRGFIYVVSLTGTTGVRRTLGAGVSKLLAGIRQVTDTPVVVGFGISQPDQIRHLQGQADGVVVGSRIVEGVRQGEDIGALVKELKHATRSQTHADCHADGSQ